MMIRLAALVRLHDQLPGPDPTIAIHGLYEEWTRGHINEVQFDGSLPKRSVLEDGPPL